MAELASIRTMLDRIGFIAVARDEITGDQGIDPLDELRTLDNSMVENLCRVIRRPGGTVGGAADPGIKVSARAEENLKLAIYYIKHQDQVSRDVVIGSITLTNIRVLSNQHHTEKNTLTLIHSPRLMERIDQRPLRPLKSICASLGVLMAYR